MEIQLPDYRQHDTAPLPAYTPHSVGTSSQFDGSSANISSYFPSVDTANTSVENALQSDFSYASNNMTLNMGSKIWDAECPAYGRGAVIQGWLTLRTVKYVNTIEILAEGSILTSIVNRQGKWVTLGRYPLLRKSVNAYDSRQAKSVKAGLQVPFRFEIPASPILPPSSEFTHPRSEISVQVQYRIRVEMTRKLWKRGESLEAPILYLPKSCPNPFNHNPPPLPDDYDWKLRDDHDSIEWKNIVMRSSSIDGIDRAPEQNLDTVSVKLEFPQPLSYKCGTAIPYRLSLGCPSTDGIEAQQLRNLFNTLTTDSSATPLTVTLLRIMTVIMSNRKVLSESVVSEGVVSGVKWDDSANGNGSTSSTGAPVQQQQLSFRVSGNVTGGKPEGEMSWNVPGVAELQYAIRVTLCIPANGSVGARYYRHTEAIGLTTHSREEVATEAGEDHPVLALMPVITSTGPE